MVHKWSYVSEIEVHVLQVIWVLYEDQRIQHELIMRLVMFYITSAYGLSGLYMYIYTYWYVLVYLHSGSTTLPVMVYICLIMTGIKLGQPSV